MVLEDMIAMPGGRGRTWIRNTLMLLVAAAVVVPVSAYGIRHAKEVSKERTCAENLKHMGEACAMYQSDWHDVLVPYGSPFAWTGHMWPELLGPYFVKLPKNTYKLSRPGSFMECPALPPEEQAWGMDYGMNTECGGWMSGGKPVVVRPSNVKYPAKTIRIAETRWLETGMLLLAARPSEFKPGDDCCRMFPARHRGKGNVLWIDGHVSAMTRAQYNMRDKGPYDGNIWLRLEGPKPPLP